MKCLSCERVRKKCQVRMYEIMSGSMPDQETATIQTHKINLLQEVTEWIDDG